MSESDVRQEKTAKFPMHIAHCQLGCGLCGTTSGVLIHDVGSPQSAVSLVVCPPMQSLRRAPASRCAANAAITLFVSDSITTLPEKGSKRAENHLPWNPVLRAERTSNFCVEKKKSCEKEARDAWGVKLSDEFLFHLFDNVTRSQLDDFWLSAPNRNLKIHHSAVRHCRCRRCRFRSVGWIAARWECKKQFLGVDHYHWTIFAIFRWAHVYDFD